MARSEGAETSGSSDSALAVVLVAYVLSRAVVVAVAAHAFRHSALWHARPLLRVSPPGTNATLSPLASWDAGWYLHIAAHGYQTSLHPAGTFSGDMAFFPLLPLLLRAFHAATGLSYEAAGSVLVFLAGAGATVAVWAALRVVTTTAFATRATLFWIVFPGSVVLSLTYAEAFTVLFAAVCLWGLARRRWWLAGTAAALAGLTQPVGCVLVACCAWSALSSIRYARQRTWAPLASALLSPIGTVAYMAWLWARTNDPFAWFTAETRIWRGHATPSAPVHLLGQFATAPTAANAWVPVAGLAFAVAALFALATWKVPSTYRVYAVGVAVLALLSAPVQLRPRILEAAFPLTVALVRVVPRWLYHAAIPALAAGLVALTVVTVSGAQLTP